MKKLFFAIAGVALGITFVLHGNDVEKARVKTKQEDANVQFNLGVAYENVRSVRKDYVTAVEWYRKAAEQGLALAQSNLGGMSNGRGVAKDEAKAVEWYRKAAEQGVARAQFNLGVMYDNGIGVGKDEAKAVEWFRKAADQGFELAKEILKELGY